MINTTSSSSSAFSFSFDELLIFEIVEQLDADRDKGVPAEAFDADRDKGVPGSSRTVEVRLTLEQLEAFDADRDRGVPGSRRTPAALIGVVTPVILWWSGVLGGLGSGVPKLPTRILLVTS